MSLSKRFYHDYICGDYDEALEHMLEDMYSLEYIQDQEYLEYMSAMRDAGFSKEDSLSIFTHLISEEQEKN